MIALLCPVLTMGFSCFQALEKYQAFLLQPVLKQLPVFNLICQIHCCKIQLSLSIVMSNPSMHPLFFINIIAVKTDLCVCVLKEFLLNLLL